MWLIPTRDRPHAVAGMIQACRETEVPDAAVMVDHGDRQADYKNIDWPESWRVFYAERHLESVGAINALFAEFPNEPFYGINADHARPRTPGWASELARSAGSWNIVYSEDNWLHGKWPGAWKNGKGGEPHLSGGICLGGELVRLMGWVFPPFLIHLCADDVLEDIGRALGNMVYRPDVTVESEQHVTGHGETDNNHARRFGGVRYPGLDRKAYLEWKESSWLDSLSSRYAKARLSVLNIPG